MSIARSIACLTALLLTGCAATGRGTEYCSLARPIFIARADQLTQRTAEAVLRHDETWRETCAR
ncbi:MAG: hypothetical protein J0H82_04615 [Alphaproteobacteria bacterium]|jgi:hypothetical protein|nr:hypothetical protein [Alphaproteobacteria bacterium]